MNGEDILFAMTSLGFENYAEALKIYLSKYREASFLSSAGLRHVLTYARLSRPEQRTKTDRPAAAASRVEGRLGPLAMRQQLEDTRQTNGTRPARHRDWILATRTLLVAIMAAWHPVTTV